jgi:hypothetical protein
MSILFPFHLPHFGKSKPISSLSILSIGMGCFLSIACDDSTPSMSSTNLDQMPSIQDDQMLNDALTTLPDLAMDQETDPEIDLEINTEMDLDVEGMDMEVEMDAALPPTPSFAINWPIFTPPTNTLENSDISSCAVYQETQCVNGQVQQCDIYDLTQNQFSAQPNPLVKRAYLYDRWHDLFSSPNGQTAERTYTQPMTPGTPESTWTDPAYFAGWAGAGDSGIWSGTALNSFILRYLHTGTEADYKRMEDKARTMVQFFEVTQIPGYLSRFHYLLVPEGTPQNPDYIHRDGPGTDDERDIDEPNTLDFLPEHYFSGLGTPRWSGDPSIDQMSGPMVAFPMIYGLLRDEDLKSRIVYQMTCYIHRLRRIEIINLKDNPDVLDAFRQYFTGDTLNLDEGDIDFESLDRIVMYVHPQINTQNEDEYDRSCGDFIQMEPWRVIDATAPTFFVDTLNLVQDLSRAENRPNHINHFYIPSIRGGDAVHMMHLTLMAYAFTGDERYADFLRNELLGQLKTADVARTLSALIPPRYCRKFYGTNIIGGPLWAFNNLLADSELDRLMQEVMRDEMWEKECSDLGNVNFNLMYASTVSPEIGGDSRQLALNYALATLPEFGGNGGILDDPRRTYRKSIAEIVEIMPETNSVMCPSPEERDFCERELNLFGVTLPGQSISSECTGAEYECVMDDGLCTSPAAANPLPPALRSYGDYTWQRSPYKLGDTHPDGLKQSPGSDYTEQYWMARFYGFIQGNQEILAWKTTEQTCP